VIVRVRVQSDFSVVLFAASATGLILFSFCRLSLYTRTAGQVRDYCISCNVAILNATLMIRAITLLSVLTSVLLCCSHCPAAPWEDGQRCQEPLACHSQQEKPKWHLEKQVRVTSPPRALTARIIHELWWELLAEHGRTLQLCLQDMENALSAASKVLTVVVLVV